jgi:hypothetical protein
MGQRPNTIQNNFTAGEISPRALGRFDITKYANAAETVENFLIYQLGGAVYRPGTRFVAECKTSSNKSRLLKFQYSTTQSYVIEAGDLYFRYYTDSGQLQSTGTPVELVTPFAIGNLSKIRYTQNADTMYITTGVYPVQKHQRTDSTTFSIGAVNFLRGPFLDTNITSKTISPSAATGSGITLTASDDLFESDHIGSLWRVKNGVVKITGFNSATLVQGDVQDEPDGTAGDLGGTTPTDDWAEGAWSAVRGYPKVCTFHEGRLYFAHTTYQPGGVWASVPFAYENFDAGNGDDDDAISIELNADTVVAIRWLQSSPRGLQAGTTGGVFSITSGSQSLPVTPDNVSAPREGFVGAADIEARKMGSFVYFVKNDLQRFIESGYQFDIDSIDAVDTTLLADHILNAPVPSSIPGRFDHNLGGAYDIEAQQSPNDRIWIVRDDGQISVLTRNHRQEVNGWTRIVGGQTVECDGVSGRGAFESIAIIQREGLADQIWVQCNRLIGGAVKRFIEYFTPENFKYDWDAVRLDCSLTLDNPIDITGVTLAEPVIITAPYHGLSDGDQIKIDNVVGTKQLNGNIYQVAVSDINTFALYEVD